MPDTQEEFDLKPRVTPDSSREDLLKHIQDCHSKLLHLEASRRMATRAMEAIGEGG